MEDEIRNHRLTDISYAMISEEKRTRIRMQGLAILNMDTGCVELLLRDGRMISIDCTGVENALDVTMAQRSELDYLIYNDPLGYADLILNGDLEEYLGTVISVHGFGD